MLLSSLPIRVYNAFICIRVIFNPSGVKIPPSLSVPETEVILKTEAQRGQKLTLYLIADKDRTL